MYNWLRLLNFYQQGGIHLLISQIEPQSQTLPSLAPVFGINGNIDYQMPPSTADAFAKCHALQPYGKLILGGYNLIL